MKKKMVLLAVLVLLVSSFGLSACGKGKSSETLHLISAGCYGPTWEQSFMRDKIIANFEKETGIRVTLDIMDATQAKQKIKTEQDSGEYVSDMVIAHSGEMPNLFKQNGWMQDIAADVQFSGRTISSEFDDVTKLGDAQYFMPISTDAYVMVVNKKALPYLPQGADKNDLTWEEFVQWGINIKTGVDSTNRAEGARIMLPAQTQYNMVYIMGGIGLAYGADFVDIDSEDMYQAYGILQQIIDNGLLISGNANYNNAIDKMRDETAWLSYQHMGPAGEIAKYAPSQIEILPTPRGDEGMGSVVGAWGIGVLDGAPRKAQAIKFIEYMTRPEVNQQYCVGLGGHISVVKEVTDAIKAKPESERSAAEKNMLYGLNVYENGVISSVPSAQYTSWNAIKGIYDQIFEKLSLYSITDPRFTSSDIPGFKRQVEGLKDTRPSA